MRPGERQALLPDLLAGDFLLFEEVKGPKTGHARDADPQHRQVVQLEDVKIMPAGDPAYRDILLTMANCRSFRPGDTALPLLQVTWRRVDALQFPNVSFSAYSQTRIQLLNVSVARGNIVLADHGRTIEEIST